MALIVALRGDASLPPGDRQDFPVLSICSDVDSGYILERIYFYYGEEPGGISWEHDQASSPHDFNIGKCRFVKEGDLWYFVSMIGEIEYRYQIVYGADVLEAYGSGEMFSRLQQLFSVD